MSHILYLVRHGIAADASAKMSDADRSLTPEGARKIKRVAVGLKRLGIVPAAVLASPLRRAQETAEILAAVLAPDHSLEIYAPLAPGQGAGAVVRGLSAYRRSEAVMLVGHEPGMSELTSHLLTGSSSLLAVDFKKGGVAAIEVGAMPPRARGRLLWLMTQKELRVIGRRRH